MSEIFPIIEEGTTAAADSGRTGYLPHVAKGAIINLFGAFSRTVLLYGYTLLLARALSASDLGRYFLMFTIINILGLVATAGLDYGVVRYVALFAGQGRNGQVRRTLAAALYLALPISVAVAGGVIAIAPQISGLVLDNSDPSILALRVFSASIPFWVAARILNATTQGLHHMQYQVYSRDMGEQLSKFLFSVLVLILGAGLIGIVWANVASLAVAAGLSLWFAVLAISRLGRTGPSHDSPAREIYRYSFPLAFSNILSMVMFYSDTLLMGYLGSATDVGYYGAAFRLVIGTQAILLAFSTVFTPVIADLYGKRLTVELQDLYKTVGRWIFTSTLPVFLVLVLLAEPVMRVFGAEFTEGSGALMVLAVSQLVVAATGTAGLMVLMSGRSQMELLNLSIALVVNVAMCFVLIPAYGLIGAAASNLVSIGLLNLIRALEVWIFMRMHAYDRHYLKPLLAGGAGAVMVLVLGRFLGQDTLFGGLLLPGALMLAIYVFLIVALGLNDNDKAVLGMVRTRLTRGEAL